MEQGNPNKVSAIVDEIVRNNAMFKLKSPIERDKEKYSMEKSINTALSELNETGKELVLEELAVNPDEKFKGFIDNAGNIDISGILKFTSAVVKVKIEEAQREGINLRKDGPGIVNGTNFKPEDVIAMAAIGEMISNYENLTDKQKASLFNEKIYMAMSNEDRRRLNDKVYEEASKKDLSDKERRKVERLRRETLINEAYLDIIEKNPNLSFEQISAEIERRHPELSEKEIREQCKKYHRDDRTSQENSNAAKKSTYENTTSITAITVKHQYNNLVKKGLVREAEEYILSYKDEIPEIDRYYHKMKESGAITIEQDTGNDLETQTVQLEAREDNVSNEDKNNALAEFKNEAQTINNALEEKKIDIQNEIIAQLTTIYEKEGQTIEDKNIAISIYADFLKEIDEEVIADFKNKSEDELIDFMKKYFEDFKDNMSSNSFEILQGLAQNTFGGNLYKLLTNKQMLEEVLLPTLNSEMERLGSSQELEVVTAQEKSKNEEDVTPITDTDVEQGVRQGTLKQEDLIVDTASVRTAQNEEEGRVNVEILNTEQAEQGVNSKPFKNVSAFMGIIGDEKDNVAESDLEETLAELETAAQMIEQDLQVTQGNIGNPQTNLNQEQTIKEDEGIEQ